MVPSLSLGIAPDSAPHLSCRCVPSIFGDRVIAGNFLPIRLRRTCAAS
jgi:hypothetical protein